MIKRDTYRCLPHRVGACRCHAVYASLSPRVVMLFVAVVGRASSVKRSSSNWFSSWSRHHSGITSLGIAPHPCRRVTDRSCWWGRDDLASLPPERNTPREYVPPSVIYTQREGVRRVQRQSRSWQQGEYLARVEHVYIISSFNSRAAGRGEQEGQSPCRRDFPLSITARSESGGLDALGARSL